MCQNDQTVNFTFKVQKNMLKDIAKKPWKICKQMGNFRRKIEAIKWSQVEVKSCGNRNKDIQISLMLPTLNYQKTGKSRENN